MAFRTKKISQMDPKGSNLASTDLLEISELVSGSYVTKSITGAEIVAGVGSGFVPTTRTLTINGTTQDLSADRTFTISTGITIGTTAITSGTIGRVLFEGTGNVVQESANLFWDNTNGRLGIGTSTPSVPLEVNGNVRITQSGSTTFGVNIATTGGATTITPISSTSNITLISQNSNSYLSLAPSSVALVSRGGNLFVNALNVLAFETGASSTERARFATTTGNFLINTTTDAGFKLDVNGTARVVNDLSLGTTSTTGANIIVNRSAVGSADLLAKFDFQRNSISTGYIEAKLNSSLLEYAFYANGQDHFRLTTSAASFGKSNGLSNIQVSIWAASNHLTLGNPTSAITNIDAIFQSGYGEVGKIRVIKGANATPSGAMAFYTHNGTASVENMRIAKTGNVLINTTTDAGYKLDVNGTARVNTLTIGLGGGQIATNTTLGFQAGDATATAGGSTYIGYQAGNKNTAGSITAIGHTSALNNTSGDGITAIGGRALLSNTTGNYNTALGYSSLLSNTTGSSNTAIGVDTSSGNFTGSVILGRNATATANNQFVVGSSGINAGSVTTEVNVSTQVWNVIINGVARKILLA